jgi:hypothetical protein
VTHAEFVVAYRENRITVHFDPALAGKFLSARLLLPLFMLPVLGAGVALALLGHVWIGLTIIALGIVAPRLLKRSAPHFLLSQALEDETVFNDLVRAGIVNVSEADTTKAGTPEATP